ncbi:MAG: hypothetical protein MI743_05475 [Sneathiellales bacterium]|nr:hypothetical protein [Sneathiellales bacterium]
MSHKENTPHRIFFKAVLTGAGVLAAPLYIHLIMTGAEEKAVAPQSELALQHSTEKTSR